MWSCVILALIEIMKPLLFPKTCRFPHNFCYGTFLCWERKRVSHFGFYLSFLIFSSFLNLDFKIVYRYIIFFQAFVMGLDHIIFYFYFWTLFSFPYFRMEIRTRFLLCFYSDGDPDLWLHWSHVLMYLSSMPFGSLAIFSFFMRLARLFKYPPCCFFIITVVFHRHAQVKLAKVDFSQWANKTKFLLSLICYCNDSRPIYRGM